MPLAVSPDRRVLYASIRSEPYRVLSLAIHGASGRLREIGSAPLPASMCWISTDRSGRFLLCASYGSSLVAVSPIGADGIAGAAQQVVATQEKAHSIQVTPDNRFALAACLGGGVVRQMRFDAATGHLADNDPPAWHARPGAGPRHFVFHPRAPVVFLLNELDATIDVLAFDRGRGTLRSVAFAPMLPPAFRRRRAVGSRPASHARRTLPVRQRAPLEHARIVRRRRGERRADAARIDRDRDRAARLRGLARRALPDRRRPGIAPSQPLRDRQRAAARSRSSASSRSAAIRTGSRSSTFRPVDAAARRLRRARRAGGGDGDRPLRFHADPADDAARRRRRPARRELAGERQLPRLPGGALVCTLSPPLARMRWRPRWTARRSCASASSAPGFSRSAWRCRSPPRWPALRFAAGLASALVFIYTSGWCLVRLAALGKASLGGLMFAGPGAGIIASGLLAHAMVGAGQSAADAWLLFGVAAAS